MVNWYTEWKQLGDSRRRRPTKSAVPDNGLELPPCEFCRRRRPAPAVIQVEVRSEYFQVVLPSSLHSAWVSTTSPRRLRMTPSYPKRAPSDSSLCRQAAEAPCSSGKRLPILPTEESLSSTRCVRCRDHVNPIGNAPTRVHQRGIEERDPVNYPALHPVEAVLHIRPPRPSVIPSHTERRGESQAVGVCLTELRVRTHTGLKFEFSSDHLGRRGKQHHPKRRRRQHLRGESSTTPKKDRTAAPPRGGPKVARGQAIPPKRKRRW